MTTESNQPHSDTEPLWLLRSIPYSEYKQSAWWKQRRDLYKETTFDDNLSCELCGIEDGSIAEANGHETEGRFIRFHVHHKTYARLGAEIDDDLLLLCSMCHNLVHHPETTAAHNWAEHSAKSIHYWLYQQITGRTSLP